MKNILFARMYFLANKDPPSLFYNNAGVVNRHVHIVTCTSTELNQRGREYYGKQYFSGLFGD